MKNKAVLSLFHALTDTTNNTFSGITKYLAENNDYEGISEVASIWSKFDAFLDALDEEYQTVANVSFNEVIAVGEAVIDAEVVSTGQYDYDSMKLFIFNYIGSRGGKCLISDLCTAFHDEFSSTFTAIDYASVSGNTLKWQSRMYDQVKTLRKQGTVNPKAKGNDYHYYSLTPKALKHYLKYNAKIEKQLNFPEMEIGA